MTFHVLGKKMFRLVFPKARFMRLCWAGYLLSNILPFYLVKFKVQKPCCLGAFVQHHRFDRAPSYRLSYLFAVKSLPKNLEMIT